MRIQLKKVQWLVIMSVVLYFCPWLYSREGVFVRVVRVMSRSSFLVKPEGEKVYRIGLLGLQEVGVQNRGGIRWISRLVLGKKVLLEYAKRKADSVMILKAYVFLLDKKESINEQVIRKGHAMVSKLEHRLKERFMEQEKKAIMEKRGVWGFGFDGGFKFEDSVYIGKLTVDLVRLYENKSQESFERVFKKYGITSWEDLREYFQAVGKFERDQRYQRILKYGKMKKIKKIKKIKK